MDIEKERAEFERLPEIAERLHVAAYTESLGFYHAAVLNSGHDVAYVNGAWMAWKAAKAESHKSASLYQWEINHLVAANQQWRDYAAKAIAVPDGYVVVPKEPTAKINNAGLHEYRKLVGLGPDGIGYIYKAMIEAAQEQNR